MAASGRSPGGAACSTGRGSSVEVSAGVVLVTLGEGAAVVGEVVAGALPDVDEGPTGEPEDPFSLPTDESADRPVPKVPLISPSAAAETTTRATRATASRFRLTFARTSRTR